MPILELRNLSKRFGAHTVLNDVSLAVEAGEVVAIIGRSGSGKSTLLRCINGLERPEAGSIVFDGRPLDLSSRGIHALRKEIAIVFQHFNLFPHLSIERNLTLASTVTMGIDKERACERARELLKMVGLEGKLSAYPPQLSGGQQQRVAIARALTMDPRLVLFDEITASLDPELVGEVVLVLEKLAQGGMTMVLVTHEMGFARKSANTILFMHQGKIWEKGDASEIFERPKTQELRSFLDAVLPSATRH